MSAASLILAVVSLSAASCVAPLNSASYYPQMSPREQAAMERRIEAGYQKDRREDHEDWHQAADAERISNIGRPPSYNSFHYHEHDHTNWSLY